MTHLQSAAEGAAYPRLTAMRELLQSHHRFSRDILDRGHATFGKPWAVEFESMLQKLFPSADALAAATKGYSAFALDSLRLQARFERDRVYQSPSIGSPPSASQIDIAWNCAMSSASPARNGPNV
jgi:hypothetical protein